MAQDVDPRDGNKYKTVTIGEQTWMAQNLNYEAEHSWCYNNDTINCKKYGRLYDWKTAMAACPEGWHLPSLEEWDILVYNAGGDNAGRMLKSRNLWNGTDDYGFSALPGGFRVRGDKGFNEQGRTASWWTSTEYNETNAHFNSIKIGDDVGEFHYDKSGGLSVRCVKSQEQ
jgi:uncharacterized protein (TIGR02145 family)